MSLKNTTTFHQAKAMPTPQMAILLGNQVRSNQMYQESVSQLVFLQDLRLGGIRCICREGDDG